MTILVSGATGSIGSQLVKQLAGQGADVRALVRSQEKGEAISGPGVTPVVGDMGQPETLTAALDGVEKAFLLTSGSPDQVAWQSNFITAAKSAGVKHVVKLSGLGVAEDSPIALARWHWQTEQELTQSGLDYTILQPHSFMQNFLANAQSVAAEGKLYAPMKDAKIGAVDVRDIAAVAAATLTEDGHSGQTYVVTGPELISYTDAAAHIGQAIGKPVEYVDVPPEVAGQGMRSIGMPDWLIADMLTLFGVFSAGHGEVVTDVVQTVAKKEPITFARFAKDYAEVFKGG